LAKAGQVTTTPTAAPVVKASFTFRGNFSIGNVTTATEPKAAGDARRRRRRRERRASALVAAEVAAASASARPGASSGSLIATLAKYASSAAQSFSEWWFLRFGGFGSRS